MFSSENKMVENGTRIKEKAPYRYNTKRCGKFVVFNKHYYVPQRLRFQDLRIFLDTIKVFVTFS